MFYKIDVNRILADRNPFLKVLVAPNAIKGFTALLLILALAFPVRIWIRLGPFASFSPIDVILLLGFVVLLLHVLFGGVLRLGHSLIATSLTIPVFFAFLSLLWTVNLTETVKAVLVYAEAMTAFLIAIETFNGLKSETIARLMGIFVFVIILTSFLSEMRFPGLNPQIPPDLVPGSESYSAFIRSYYARLSHPFIGLSNNLATVLAFFPIIFSGYAEVTKKNRFHWLAIFCTLAIVLTLSRGVILALMVAYGFYALCHRFSLQRLWRSGVGLVLIIAGVIMFVMFNPTAKQHLTERLSSQGIDCRLETWRSILAAIPERPLLGSGAGVSAKETVGALLKSPHNAFLAQIFYFGLLGGSLVAGSILSIPVFFLLWPISGDKTCLMRRAIILSLIAQLFVFVSQASFEGSVLRVLFYFSVGSSVMFLHTLEKEAMFVSSASGKCNGFSVE